MSCDAVQRIRAAVQEEALLRIDPVTAHAEAHGNFIHIRKQLKSGRVKIRIFNTVPQVRLLKPYLLADLLRCRYGFLCGNVSLRILNQNTKLPRRLPDPCLHPDHRAAVLSRNRRNLCAAPAQIIQVKMRCGHGQNRHVPVHAAVERKVRVLRINRIAGRIVHGDRNDILFLQKICDIRPPGRIAALVRRDLFAVDIKYGCCGCSLKLQIIAVRLRQILPGKAFRIPAGAAVIIAPAVLSVDAVPGVRDVDKIPLSRKRHRCAVRHLGKRPLVIP